MGFFDLNIPYYESDRHVTDKSSIRGRRLKLALKAMELGYTGVAYNRTLKGVMSESDRCATTLFPLSKLISPSSSFLAAVKLHRELLNVPVSSPFRQYTRLTVVVDIPSQASALNAGNPILKSYDVVAVRPMNQNAFDQACQTSEVDMIAIDFSDKLPFRLKQPMVKAAIKRGVYFEIIYSGLIADAQSRRQMISSCKLLVEWTRGKNLIFCSGAPSATELRGPQDVVNLFSLLGLSGERAKAAISKNCRSLLASALRKKHFYKEAVKVEGISSGGQVNPAQSTFDDWLKWDPISSGEGDLLLDDMEKSFATSHTVTKTVKAINFTSNMNGLPAHGLQIKDLICLTNTASEAADSDNFGPVAMETEEASAVEKPDVQGGFSPLHEQRISLPENQGSLSTLSEEQEEVILLPEGLASSSGVTNKYLASGCQDFTVSLDSVPKSPVALVPLPEPEEGQISLNDAKIGYLASGSEDSAMLSLSTYNGTCTTEETVSTSSQKLSYSNDLEANPVASETQSQDAPFQVYEENTLHDVLQVHSTDNPMPINNNHASIELSNSLNNSSSSPLKLEEATVENVCDVGVCAQEFVALDKVLDKIDRESQQEEPLASSDPGPHDIHVDGERNVEMTCGSVKLGDGLSIEGSINPKTDSVKPILDDVMGEKEHIDPVTNYQVFGKSLAGRRKRNSPHQPFLFPFKRFLNLRHFKRKSWKRE